MQVFMFRHAEKENTGTSNPPLSRRGLLQSQKLADMVANHTLPTPTKCFSSPLLRAKQTFAKLNTEVILVEDLIERQSSETAAQFHKRVRKFLQSLETLAGVVFFVTHLDWIEEALILMDTGFSVEHWPPAQVAEFELNDGHWQFQLTRGCEP
jgi:broad specificity phosphatase PhoE